MYTIEQYSNRKYNKVFTGPWNKVLKKRRELDGRIRVKNENGDIVKKRENPKVKI
jgi:hypothetical protein